MIPFKIGNSVARIIKVLNNFKIYYKSLLNQWSPSKQTFVRFQKDTIYFA